MSKLVYGSITSIYMYLFIALRFQICAVVPCHKSMEGSRGITPRGKLRMVETRGCGLVCGLGTNLGRSGRKPEVAVKLCDL